MSVFGDLRKLEAGLTECSLFLSRACFNVGVWSHNFDIFFFFWFVVCSFVHHLHQKISPSVLSKIINTGVLVLLIRVILL